MSALQVAWLTNHYEQGKITQEEFTSLFKRIRMSEKESVVGVDKVSDTKRAKLKVARLHPETRRTLARVRTFKKLVKVMNYTMLLALISVVYLSAEYYQVTGSLPKMSVAGLEKLLTQTPRKPLPSDIKLAAEFLSQQSDWDESHVSQFSERWQNTLSSDRMRFSNEYWFQGLRLALSLHIAEQRILAKNGNRKAIQQAVLLTQLAEKLENQSA
ncbi:hypothetical protein [Kaarinaea lacus]